MTEDLKSFCNGFPLWYERPFLAYVHCFVRLHGKVKKAMSQKNVSQNMNRSGRSHAHLTSNRQTNTLTRATVR